MNVLHLASVYDVIKETSGARAQMIYYLIKEQANMGYNVYVLANKNSKLPEGCELIAFSPSSLPTSSKFSFWFFRRISESMSHLKATYLLKNEIDIIHSHILEEGLYLSRLFTRPTIVTNHGATYTSLSSYFILKLFSSLSNSYIVAISRRGYEINKEFFGNKVLGYVYNPLDVNRIPFIKKPNTEYELVISFAGRIIPIKGPHIAIKVADMLYNNGVNVFLKIHGLPYPGYLNYLRFIYSECRKRKYVDLRLNVSKKDLYVSLGNSDVVLFPSIFEEPFGYVMVESMATGTPVVAFEIGSTSEIIKNNVSGFTCKSINDMARYCIEAKSLDRNKIRNYVCFKFNPRSISLEYHNIYKLILGT